MLEDDIQVRIGVSLDGVQQSDRIADKAEKKATRAKTAAGEAKIKADAADASIKSAQKAFVQGLGRVAIAGAVGEGLEALIPEGNHAAVQQLRSLGVNITMNSMLMGSLKGGIVVGAITQGLTALTQGFAALKAQVEADHQKVKDNENRLASLREQFQKAITVTKEDIEKEVRKMRERSYIQYRESIVGGV